MKKIKLYLFLFLIITNVFAQFEFDRVIKSKPIPKSAFFSTIAVSRFGNIYLLESKGNTIYQLNSDGKVVAENGGYGWDEGQFDMPVDISISSGLDLLVADYNNHRIVRFDRKLNYLTSYPNTNSDYELSYPRSVVLTNLGEIFILSGENNDIVRLQLNPSAVTRFAGVEYDKYALVEPIQIRMSDAGILHILQANGQILQYDRFGTPVGRLVIPVKTRPVSMTLLGKNVIVATHDDPTLMMYLASSQKWSLFVIAGLPESSHFSSIAFKNEQLYLLSDDGKIYICNYLREK